MVSEHVQMTMEYFGIPQNFHLPFHKLEAEFPELTWIAEKYRVVALSYEGNTLKLVLDMDGDMDGTGVVAVLTHRDGDTDYTVIVPDFSDEDVVFSDCPDVAYSVDEDFDFEEYDKEVEEELEKWENYRKVYELGNITITVEGAVRSETSYLDVEHEHYFKDRIITLKGNVPLFVLLAIAPYMLYIL